MKSNPRPNPVAVADFWAQLSPLMCGITVAYVTYEDLSQISVFQDQTLITVRAPEETKLDVPMPREVSPVWVDEAPENVLFIYLLCNIYVLFLFFHTIAYAIALVIQ